MKSMIVIGAVLLTVMVAVEGQIPPPAGGNPILLREDELGALGVGDLSGQRTPTTRTIGGRRFAVVPVTGQAQRRRVTTTTTTAARTAGGIPPPLARVELDEDLGPPIPYAFNFAAEGEDGGSHSREESRGADGVVEGSYTINDPDGRTRTVRYVADANGFRAEVTTNEIGTESHAPAGVNFASSAPSVASLVADFEATRLRSAPVERRIQTVTTRRAAGPAGQGRVIVLNSDQLQGAAAENIQRLLRSGRARIVSAQPIN